MHVLELYSSIFYNEKIALERKLSKEDGLKYYQEHSSSIMVDIKKYCDLLKSKKIEPNDVFGKSIAYQNKHWDGLTLFLKVAGAPLTTNSVERSLKAAIRNRKNSLKAILNLLEQGYHLIVATQHQIAPIVVKKQCNIGAL